ERHEDSLGRIDRVALVARQRRVRDHLYLDFHTGPRALHVCAGWRRRGRADGYPSAQAVVPQCQQRGTESARLIRSCIVVPMEGVEPTHPYGYQILSLARLPIPPHRLPSERYNI